MTGEKQKRLLLAFRAAATYARKKLLSATNVLVDDGQFCVHVVCAGHEEILYESVHSSNEPNAMLRQIAKKRALWQVRLAPKRTSFVPEEFEISYPEHVGSAYKYNVCVGVASSEPENDGVIAEMYAWLIYRHFEQELKAANLLKQPEAA